MTSVLRSSIVVCLFFLLLSLEFFAQDNPQSQPQTQPTSSQILQFLGETIDWYRQTQQEQRITTEPGDLGFSADNRRMADQIVKLAFDFARLADQQLAKDLKGSIPNPSEMGSRYENLSRAAANADTLVQQTQVELQALKEKFETTPPAKRKQLQSQIDETQSELALFQARQQALHSMLDFAGGASKGGGNSLRAQIDELAHAVPAAVSGATSNETVTSPTTPTKVNDVSSKTASTGMWALAADLFRLSSKRSLLASSSRATRDLEQTATQLRTPLVTHLKQLIQAGDQLAKEA